MNTVGSYYLLGPIKVDSTLILTYSRDKIAYFMTLVKGQNGDPDDLIFDPRITSGEDTVSNPLVFRVVSIGLDIGLTYQDSANNLQYVSGIKVGNKTLAGPSDKSSSLIPFQTEAAAWPNIPFLTGVQYQFQTTSNQVISWKTYLADGGTGGASTHIKMKNNLPRVAEITSGIRILPTSWLQKGTCDSTSGINIVVSMERAWIAGETGQFSDGFTDQDDCTAGVRYTYCPPKKMCSTSCKGPCPNSNESGLGCFFDQTSKGFKCEDNPINEPWYRQPWFIILVVISAAIIVILIIFIIFRFTSSRT